MNREKIIVRTGFIGILANVFLAGFKAVIGFVSGSIAITMDAVNNLSDALSSVITIISTKLANRRPDKKQFSHRLHFLIAVSHLRTPSSSLRAPGAAEAAMTR